MEHTNLEVIEMIDEARVRRYCVEDISKIENYDKAIKDKTQTWECHHRRETIYSKKDLIEIGEYYHRPSIELIFLTKSDHTRLHNNGKHHSEDTKRKLSESRIGKSLSEDTKRKMSEPILQYTKDGTFIKEWIGGTEAERELGISHSSITKCCKGKLKSSGGFIWKYKEV